MKKWEGEKAPLYTQHGAPEGLIRPRNQAASCIFYWKRLSLKIRLQPGNNASTFYKLPKTNLYYHGCVEGASEQVS